MFDIGWTEMLVIAVVMIVVVGPKDLPKMLRTFGRTTTKLRAMAGDFQKQFNEALKEAELDDVKNSLDELRKLNPANEIKKSLNPFEKAAADVRAGIQGLQTPPKPAVPLSEPPVETPLSTDAIPAEPLKNGAVEIPAGPTAMPEPPVMTHLAKPVSGPVTTAAKAPRKPAAVKAVPKELAAKATAPKAVAAKAGRASKPAAKAPAKPVASPKTVAKSAKPKSKST